MGYFSELDITIKEEYADRSYHGPEAQLLWRYEELKYRYSELLDSDAPCVGEVHFSSDDYRYAPIECFVTVSDIYRAMEIAKEDLRDRYGITVRDDGSIEEPEEDDPNQLNIFEIVLLPTWFQTAVAA